MMNQLGHIFLLKIFYKLRHVEPIGTVTVAQRVSRREMTNTPHITHTSNCAIKSTRKPTRSGFAVKIHRNAFPRYHHRNSASRNRHQHSSRPPSPDKLVESVSSRANRPCHTNMFTLYVSYTIWTGYTLHTDANDEVV